MANTSKVKSLKNKADRLARQVVLARDKHCWMCGEPADTWAHVIRRSRSIGLRWDTGNARGMCHIDHMSITHAKEGEAYHWIKHFGLDWYDELVARADVEHPSGFRANTVGRMEWVIADLERQLSEVEDPWSWTNP